jgi:hypothetical protein
VDGKQRSGLLRWAVVTVLLAALAVSGWLILHDPVERPTALAATGTFPPAIPLQTSSATTWERVVLPRQITWIPSSPDGPAVATPGQWSGWAHSPEGAVQAAFTIAAAFGLDNDAARTYLRDHTVSTPQFLDELLADRPLDGQQSQPTTMRPTGYRVAAYTPESATIDIGYRVTDAGLTRDQVLSYDMRWVDGDWRQLWLPSQHPTLSGPDTSATHIVWGPQ